MTGVISIRTATGEDTEQVCRLFEAQLLRPPNASLIKTALIEAPSALAFDGETLVGFLYCGFMAPDVVEVMNILVADDARQSGVGSMMLMSIERNMPSTVVALMLVNSMLYPDVKGGKLSATSFYLKNGYSVIAETGATRVFWKNL